MTRQEISDLFDRYEDGYQAWRGNGVMTKSAFIEAVTEALRIHDVVGRSEQLKAFVDFAEWYKDEYKQHIPIGAIKEYVKSL